MEDRKQTAYFMPLYTILESRLNENYEGPAERRIKGRQNTGSRTLNSVVTAFLRGEFLN